MGQEGLLLFATFAAFGVVTIILYFLVIRPALPNDAPDRSIANRNTQNNRGTQRGRAQNTGTTIPNDIAASAQNKSGTIEKILVQCTNFPTHVASGSQSTRRSSGSTLLTEGLVTFRHTRAAVHEQVKAENSAQNRKERARILSCMLALGEKSSDSKIPPARGSTIVASVPMDEVACPKLRRVLYLFSTYYNLLLILVVPAGTAASDLEKATMKLRGKENDAERLGEDCLPHHRIVAASTPAGRIAFVRQLARVEIVLDFDTEVKTQLTRFGYRVIDYKRQLSDKTAGMSQLGMQLLSS